MTENKEGLSIIIHLKLKIETNQIPKEMHILGKLFDTIFSGYSYLLIDKLMCHIRSKTTLTILIYR